MLPKKMPEQRAAILKAIGNKKGAKYSNKEIMPMLDERLQRNLAKVTSYMVMHGLLESVPDGSNTVKYGLSDIGREQLKNISKITITPMAEPRAYRKRETKNPPAQAKTPPAQEQVQINISSTANSVADTVTALIDENASSRRLMMNVVVMITRAYGKEFVAELAESFGLKLVEDNDDGNSATD